MLTLCTNEDFAFAYICEYLRHAFSTTYFSDDTKVKLHELVGTLKTSAKHGSLKNQLNRVQNQKVLSVPLPKHQKEKVKE